MATKTKTAPSANETVKPTELPVDLGGGRIQFVKRSEYAKVTAQNQTILLKTQVPKDSIVTMLEVLDNGKTELPSENPEEFHKVFAIVKEDYQAGVDKVIEDKRKLVEAEEKEKADKAAKENADKELFVAVKDKSADLGSLSEIFDTGNMDRCVPKADVTDEQLLTALNTGLGMSEFTGWMIGDLVLELEKRGKQNVVSEIAVAKGTNYSKIYNDAKTAKAFPPENRVKGVSFTIYREIANAKFTKEQDKARCEVIQKALEGGYTVQSVREAVRDAQGKKAPEAKAPEDDDKFKFIVVDPNAELKNIAETTIGFPKELFENGAIVINPKNGKKFLGFKAKGPNRWENLGEYTKAAPPEEKPKAKKKK